MEEYELEMQTFNETYEKFKQFMFSLTYEEIHCLRMLLWEEELYVIDSIRKEKQESENNK